MSPSILESKELTRISFRSLQFRFRYLRFSLTMAGWSLLLIVAIWLFEAISFLELLTVTLVATLGYVPLASLFVWWYFTHEVGPDGIQGYDLLNRSVRLDWMEMQTAKVKWYFGMPYGRISTPHRWALWIPLAVDQPDLLREMLRVHAPADHPVLAVFPDAIE
jgi:hypothetical protein